MDSLLSTYNNLISAKDTGDHSTIELEVRMRDITRDMWFDLYDRLASDKDFDKPTLECSINTIDDMSGDARAIRKMTFLNGVKQTDEYMTKTRLVPNVNARDMVNYAVGLSREAPGRQFSPSGKSMMRFKLRLSYLFIGRDWRLDLTAVKSGRIDDIGKSAAAIRDKMFRAVSTTNLHRELPADEIDSWEVEIEHVGKEPVDSAQIASVTRHVFGLINPDHVNSAMFRERIARAYKEIYGVNAPASVDSVKRLTNQVIALTKNTYYREVYPAEGYYLTDKADGVRCILMRDTDVVYMLTNEMREYKVTGKKSEAGEWANSITIADAEYVEATNTAYVFDVMVLGNDRLADHDFSRRLSRLDEAANRLQCAGLTVAVKRYIRVEPGDQETAFRGILADAPYETDGIILVRPGDNYGDTRNYKWKPMEQLTIDFLAVRAPSSLLGVKPFTVRDGHVLYILFVGIDHRMRERIGMGLLKQYRSLFPEADPVYYPIQFSPSIAPQAYLYWHPANGPDIDRKIVELGREITYGRRTGTIGGFQSVDQVTMVGASMLAALGGAQATRQLPSDVRIGDWKFVRVRTDRARETRYYGNDFRVAELTYMNFADPFLVQDLWSPRVGYFDTTIDVNTGYIAPNKYKRYVLSRILKQLFSRLERVIDLCAGRGADIHRLQEIGVDMALCIDSDSTALAELVRRKYEYGRMMRSRAGGSEIVKDVHGMTVYTLLQDMRTPATELVKAVSEFPFTPGQVNGIMCNFALHYFCDTDETLSNFLDFVAQMLAVGGVFLFTVLDGKAVFDLLSNVQTGESWEVRTDGDQHIKYAIRKDYSGKTLSPTGQTIAVKLPFSADLYTEPLANVDYIVRRAKAAGLAVELRNSFSHYMADFKVANESLYSRLTIDDMAYIKLHTYVVMRKVKNVTGGRRRGK